MTIFSEAFCFKKSNEEFAVHYQRQVTLLLKELRQESIMLQISTKNVTLHSFHQSQKSFLKHPSIHFCCFMRPLYNA
jgi:hypothetical protein